MGDKNLTELEWRKFSKGRKFEDKEFLKALAGLETADRAKDAAAQLKALAEFDKQATKLRAANKADKELVRYLDEADKEANLQRKLAESLAAKAAAKDEDGDAALTTGLLSLLRHVPKGEEALPAMIAVAGKRVAVLLSRRGVGAPQRKLLAEALDGAGAIKYLSGECLWEANTHTFVLEASVGGLAKLVATALLKQTGTKFKVRVRGPDPADVDEDAGDGDEAAETESTEAATSAGAAPTVETTSQTPSQPGPDEGAAFNQRLAALMPKVKDALIAAGPQAAELKLKISEAGMAARKASFAAAHALLDEAEKLLASAPHSTSTAASPEQARAAFNARLAALLPRVKDAITGKHAQADEIKRLATEAGSRAAQHDYPAGHALLDQAETLLSPPVPRATGAASVAFTQTRLAWDSTRKLVQQQLKQLEQAMLDAYRDDPDLDDLTKGTANLYRILDRLDERLIDKLDDALNAAAPEQRRARQDEAQAIIGEYQAFIEGDELMNDIDNNGFVDLTIASTVRQRLGEMSAALR